MRDLIPIDEQAPYRAPSIVALEEDAPPLSELFGFMTEAELRFESLRMRVVDRTFATRGEHVETVEITLHHPGRAKVIGRRDGNGLSRDFDVWVSDGTNVTFYEARSNTASVRPLRDRVVGATDPGLPAFARVYVPRTPLPMESIAEVFIHPHGYCRNVLVTGAVQLVGTTLLAGGRESFLLRSDHPRTSPVLTDRPDHWIEVGVDRMTGLILLLAEHIGDRITRHAEATDVELDPPIGDEVFRIHLSSDVKMLY
jgi:hypothetical protein